LSAVIDSHRAASFASDHRHEDVERSRLQTVSELVSTHSAFNTLVGNLDVICGHHNDLIYRALNADVLATLATATLSLQREVRQLIPQLDDPHPYTRLLREAISDCYRLHDDLILDLDDNTQATDTASAELTKCQQELASLLFIHPAARVVGLPLADGSPLASLLPPLPETKRPSSEYLSLSDSSISPHHASSSDTEDVDDFLSSIGIPRVAGKSGKTKKNTQ
jgi:hypothetical protein